MTPITCCKHPFIESENLCRSCGQEFCRDCLVYAFGPDQLPFCVTCAIAAAGVRHNSRSGGLSRREVKRRLRARDRIRKAAGADRSTPAGDPFADFDTTRFGGPAESATPGPVAEDPAGPRVMWLADDTDDALVHVEPMPGQRPPSGDPDEPMFPFA
jgi:hypothetical protein